MDNEDVARYLLARLPEALFDGVVYLDQQDRQVILQRDSSGHIAVPVAQCGIPLSRRFTFFDQVHTTGTDVRQAATASAVITLGKDLVFRDYAQGAYRMRGIGRGQRLTVFLIPEVVTRLQETLASFRAGDLLRDVPAWLLLNSMKIESLQFFKLSSQEVANVWRKRALQNLTADAVFANAHRALYSGYLRCRRFQLARPAGGGAAAAGLPSVALLRASIAEFREVIEYVIETAIHAPPSFLSHLQDVLTSRPAELLEGDTCAQHIVAQLMQRMQTSVAAAASAEAGGGADAALQQAHRMVDLNAEIVHEQEAEEEQEQEAEQEEQRISAFSRDDEFQVPWKVSVFLHAGSAASETVRPCHGSPFYQMREFAIRGAGGSSIAAPFGATSALLAADPILDVPPHYLLSDNFYRLQWSGVGERRLKNTFLYAEWAPQQRWDGAPLPPPQEAAAGSGGGHCYGLVTLAEGESLRWLLHHSPSVNDAVAVSLRSVASGRHMDCTQRFLSERSPAETIGGLNTATDVALDPASLLFRLFNNDMFFADAQLQVLEQLLREVPPEVRLRCFESTLRLRRRHRNHWEDAPVAVLFVTPRDRPHLRELAVAGRVRATLEEMAAAVLRAALPTAKRADRREAAAVEDALCGFAAEVTTALSAAHGGAGDAAAGVALPSRVIAQCLCDCFPTYFAPYRTSELGPALQLAVARARGGGGGGPTAAEPTIPLALLYQTYPALDLVALREHAEAARRQPGADDAAAAAPWACATCTYVNEGGTRVCAMCMAVAP
ncbi:hypothetical protein STCU_01076 [Strigomonas culicis]|uniref:ubiquitinyl hydrolase 1 n=1 Tax=Strigomonas culicis TaxID=28005 RepID=S9V3V5_9TRYP|nr:hypothetical protein STCU_01076 [Strigomonas culicis]|eukprot:EPY35598.1 hypothetical protein STCU_01076 [Strigomonas culicis]